MSLIQIMFGSMLGGIIIVVASSLLPSCKELTVKDYHVKKICVEYYQESARNFIVECAQAANPKSDEEGEDLVEQCHKTSKDQDIFCKKYIKVVGENERKQHYPCKNATGLAKKACDLYVFN